MNLKPREEVGARDKDVGGAICGWMVFKLLVRVA